MADLRVAFHRPSGKFGRREYADDGDLLFVGHIDLAGIGYELPDGRVLLDDISLRVGDGAKIALVGANGAGKTTLLRIVTGELTPHAGAVTPSLRLVRTT